MSHRCISMAVFLAVSALIPLEAIQQQKKDKKFFDSPVSNEIIFKNILDDFFNELQRESPEFATYVGQTTQYNALWAEHTEESYFEHANFLETYLKTLHRINPNSLSISDQINYFLLEKHLQESLEGYHFHMYYMPLDQLSGIPLDVEHVLATMPKENKGDYRNILSRLHGVPKLIDQTIALLEKGVEKGVTPPQVALRNLPDSIKKMIPPVVKESIFFQSFNHFPSTISLSEQGDVIAEALEVIEQKIYPAYQKLHDYLKSTYLPSCRLTIGASDLPNGEAWYRHCIRRQTTTTLNPQEIHNIGLAEVNRIRKEMEDIVFQSGFPGTIVDYFEYLNTDPQFFYDNVEDLLAGYREITGAIDKQLGNIFGRQPKLPYEVVPMPSYSEEGQIGAYYMRGSVKTGRPGRFYVNTFDLGSRPKWQMESLALHEAVPGHHFQISLAQEIESLPEFRKYLGYTAYIEGWGLYSESLGKELGLYQTPSSQFGRLIEEIWRAVRLVVDTGMHSLGWSREQAIAYFIEQTGIGEREATTEIDRYIVWPGQALAYKIGELSIQRWRKEAQEALGDKFDIRGFHDILLEQGALPLDVCEQQIYRWIASQKS